MSNKTLQHGISQFRWVICGMLFLATLVNYMDRQVLSLTYTDFIAKDFHWDDNDYGTITATFTLLYSIMCLFAGKLIDILGTKKGYLWAIIIWSAAACMHAGCGWMTMICNGAESMDALRGMEKASQVGLMGMTISVWMFLACRCLLAVGESGNFPSAIKVTAEYFPKKDRAFATSIFNSGASVGALLAPLTIPQLAVAFGWEMSFIIIGGIGFLWAGLWIIFYNHPKESKFVNEAELEYINQDDVVVNDNVNLNLNDNLNVNESEKGRAKFGIIECFGYRQTWAFIMGKFLTDCVWWFLLFWAPAYFKELGHPASTLTGQMLLFVLYLIVTVVSIGGGYTTKYFVEKRGMEPYAGRMRAMLIFAVLPLFALIAQPMASMSVWWPAILIGLAGAGHQAWSANLFSTIGDMFPRRAIATITGIGTMCSGIACFGIQKGAGMLFTFAEKPENAFSFCGVDGKPGAYMVVFCYCAIAYLLAWCVMKILVPKYKPIED